MNKPRNNRSNWLQNLVAVKVEFVLATKRMKCIILCEIHVDSRRNNAVVPGILPVTPVVRSPAAKVADDALEEADLPPFWSASS